MPAPTKLIHAADLQYKHRTWKSRPDIQGDAHVSLRQIVDACISHEADALLLSGDIFDSRHPTDSEVYSFQNEIARLARPVLYINGNHDLSEDGEGWAASPGLPHVHHLKINQPPVEIGFARIVGFDFVPRIDLADYLALLPAAANVVLAHFMLAEAAPSHVPGDISLSVLPAGDSYRYYALGDLHVRVQHADEARKIVCAYPGSTHLCAINEEPQKYWLAVDVHADGSILATPHPLITRKVFRVSVQTATDLDELLDVTRYKMREEAEAAVVPDPRISRPLVEIKYVPVEGAHQRLVAAFSEWCHLVLSPQAVNVVDLAVLAGERREVKLPDVVREAMADSFDPAAAAFTEELLGEESPSAVIDRWAQKCGVS